MPGTIRVFVAALDDAVVGSVMAGYDGHRGWINYLAVAPSCQSGGIGALLMRHAEHRLRSVGCPKVNLQVRTTNAAAAGFYRAIGFLEDDVISFGKRLVDDTAAEADGDQRPAVG
ncbi:GNAT family acetyltransferase [Ilumatobacter nonamiensis]|uniref:GNAT family acetyltransferase n=1 Tax=Ilumatobacter nonamiensis TaxID=467093 RepID=UPI0019D40D2C|nr:GNAT family acetyltransferase [Ilumatobacter nonamiensis]